MGVMLESHLVAGNQKIAADLSRLTYGQSITDACIDLDTTAAVLAGLAEAVRAIAATGGSSQSPRRLEPVLATPAGTRVP
jgi:3-deoxy-D-arabino-heptulosonate 7-phosphate (DAHP) synthase